jgi:hypothetical protein
MQVFAESLVKGFCLAAPQPKARSDSFYAGLSLISFNVRLQGQHLVKVVHARPS